MLQYLNLLIHHTLKSHGFVSAVCSAFGIGSSLQSAPAFNQLWVLSVDEHTTTMNNRRNSMKKDDKHAKEKVDRKIIRHPTAPFSMKSIIMNLIIAFFLYLLRRVIEAGGKSAITKYSRFIK